MNIHKLNSAFRLRLMCRHCANEIFCFLFLFLFSTLFLGSIRANPPVDASRGAMNYKYQLHNRYTNELLTFGKEEPQKDDKIRYYSRLGLNGEGQIVTITDSGIDSYNPFFYDSFVNVPINKTNKKHRKIVRFDSLCGITDKGHGHGTHIAGIVAGEPEDKTCGISYYSGIANKAKLYVIGISNSDYELVFDNYDIDSIVNRTKELGSYIMTNAWGIENNENLTEYKYNQICFDNPDLLMIFSVGNENSSGTVWTPATAKNVLSVGASTATKWSLLESRRKRMYSLISGDLTIPISLGTWSKDPWEVAIENATYDMHNIRVRKKINADKEDFIFLEKTATCKDISNDFAGYIVQNSKPFICMSLQVPVFFVNESVNVPFNSYQLHVSPNSENSFPLKKYKHSSYGPTETGIYKPDLVAPGDKIMSAAAGVSMNNAKEVCNKYRICSKSGSSQASAAIAGAAALVRQYYTDGWYPTKEHGIKITPSSSLIKATLISAARPIDTIYGGPTMKTGFGIPNLDAVFGLSINKTRNKKEGMRIVDRVPISSNEQQFYKFNVESKGYPLVITLSYLDFVVRNSKKPLEVDLDLILISPDGTLSFGNQSPFGADSFSTTERIIQDKAIDGEYTVIVRASKFEENATINYSLVFRAAFDNTNYTNNLLVQSTNGCFFQCPTEFYDKYGQCSCNTSTTGYLCSNNIECIEGDYSTMIRPKEFKYFRINTTEKSYVYFPKNNVSSYVRYCWSRKKFSKIADIDVTCSFADETPITFFSARRAVYFAVYVASEEPVNVSLYAGIFDRYAGHNNIPQHTFNNDYIYNYNLLYDLTAVLVCLIMIICIALQYIRSLHMSSLLGVAKDMDEAIPDTVSLINHDNVKIK